jgi:hypothetical protein
VTLTLAAHIQAVAIVSCLAVYVDRSKEPQELQEPKQVIGRTSIEDDVP